MSTVKDLEKQLASADESNSLVLAMQLSAARRKEALENAKRKQKATFIKLFQQNMDHLNKNEELGPAPTKDVKAPVVGEDSSDAVKAAVEAGTVTKKASKKAAKE